MAEVVTVAVAVAGGAVSVLTLLTAAYRLGGSRARVEAQLARQAAQLEAQGKLLARQGRHLARQDRHLEQQDAALAGLHVKVDALGRPRGRRRRWG